MIASTITALLYLSAALFYGADRQHGFARARDLPALRASLRLIACALALAAFFVFRAHEPGPGALFVVLAGTTALGTLVATAAPLFPRLVWIAAILSGLAIPLLAMLGGA